MTSDSSARLAFSTAVTILFWASAFAAIRRALNTYSPYHLALLRFITASAVLLVLAPWLKLRRPSWRDLPRLTLAGFLGIALYHCALNYGQKSVTAGAAGFVISTVPIFTALFAMIALKEQVRGYHWVGLALSLTGIILITIGEGRQFKGGQGGWFILLAALGQSLCVILQKPLFRKYSAFEVACYTLWIGSAFLIIFLPGLVQQVRSADAVSTLAVIYLGIFPAALAHLSWTYVLSRIPVSRATTLLYAVPPLSLAIAWIWLRERPALLSLFGCGFALGGVLVVNQFRTLNAAKCSWKNGLAAVPKR